MIAFLDNAEDEYDDTDRRIAGSYDENDAEEKRGVYLTNKNLEQNLRCRKSCVPE